MLIERELVEVGLKDCPRRGNACLFTFQLVGVDGVGVEGFQDLLAVASQLEESILAIFLFGRRRGQHLVDVLEHQAPDLLDVARLQGDCGPVILNEVFEVVGLDGSEGAAVLQALASSRDR